MNKAVFHRLVLPALALLVSAMPVAGLARVVRVGPADASGQGHGHGYVFGSARDGSCWLATPAHVVRTAQGTLKGTVLQDARGRSGVAINPVQPDVGVDLVFARVSGLGGACLDRLHARRLDTVLRAGEPARLNLVDSSGGGGRAMSLRIRAVDGGKGAIKFSVEPVASAADPHPRIIQGFSGGLIDRRDVSALGHDSLPVGLVLSVCLGGPGDSKKLDLDKLLNESSAAVDICTGGHYATALRFDVIHDMFAGIESKIGAARTLPEKGKHPPLLLNFDGKTLLGTPQSLIQGAGTECWTVQPGAKGRVGVEYLMPKGRKSTAIVIEACDNDGNLGGVEVRGGPDTRSTTAYRYCTASSEKLRCTIGSRKASVIRLGITPKIKKTPLKLRLIRIETAPI